MAMSLQDKRAAFRKLHASVCFILPNPWDIGSARLLPTHLPLQCQVLVADVS